MRTFFSILLACCALTACSTTAKSPDVPVTTGTDTAADVSATGDPTAGTTASPAGTPASGM